MFIIHKRKNKKRKRKGKTETERERNRKTESTASFSFFMQAGLESSLSFTAKKFTVSHDRSPPPLILFKKPLRLSFFFVFNGRHRELQQ
jgi:hypothetical protein